MQRVAAHIKSFSRKLRKDMTDAEKHLWQRIRMQQFSVKFRRQHPVASYILDFACVELKLALEVDGGQHSDLKVNDDERTKWLESQGWKVLRFWNNDVLQNIEGVLEVISSHIPPPSQPSPSKRGRNYTATYLVRTYIWHAMQAAWILARRAAFFLEVF